MQNSSVYFLILLIVLLVVAVLVFTIVDFLLKSGSKKRPHKKEPQKPIQEDKTVPPKHESENELAARKPVKFYNSELADDLNKILEEKENNQTPRIQIENRTKRESGISKYIHEKKYQGFDFDVETDYEIEEEQNLKIDRDDYKKLIALSHIDDGKPL